MQPWKFKLKQAGMTGQLNRVHSVIGNKNLAMKEWFVLERTAAIGTGYLKGSPKKAGTAAWTRGKKTRKKVVKMHSAPSFKAASKEMLGRKEPMYKSTAIYLNYAIIDGYKLSPLNGPAIRHQPRGWS